MREPTEDDPRIVRRHALVEFGVGLAVSIGVWSHVFQADRLGENITGPLWVPIGTGAFIMLVRGGYAAIYGRRGKYPLGPLD